MKKLMTVLVLGISLLLIFSSCELGNEPTAHDQYGYSVYFVCQFLAAFGAPNSNIVEVGGVSTITFTAMVYDEDSGATVTGTVIYDTNVSPETEIGSLSFTGDSAGLNSIDVDMEWDGSNYSGDFTVDGHTTSAADYQAYIESSMP